MPSLRQLTAQYKLEGRSSFQGLSIAIENDKGSIRRGVEKRTGKPWQTEMKYPYGYVIGSRGLDNEPLDCYVGPDKSAKFAFVVHQLDPVTGGWDEDKVMLGFPDSMEAKEAYCQHYDEPEKFFGSISAVPMDEFKKKVADTAKNPSKISASSPVEIKVGDPVTVDGMHGRGVVVKMEGRRVTVRFWSTEYVTRDRMYVHPFRENEVNRMWRDDQYRDTGAQAGIHAGGPGSGPNAPCPQCGPHHGRRPHYRAGSGITRAYNMLKDGQAVRMTRFREEFGRRTDELLNTLRRHGRESGKWSIVRGPGTIQLVKTRAGRQAAREATRETKRESQPVRYRPTGEPDDRPPKGYLKKDPPKNLTAEKLKEKGIELQSGSGYRSDDVVLKSFENKFQMSPEDYVHKLLDGVDKKYLERQHVTITQGGTGEASNWDVDIRTNAFHQERRINPTNGTAYHEYWQMSRNYQDGGLGKKIFANQLDLYDHLGIKKISIGANLDVGGYAWARYGFVPEKYSWNRIRADVKEAADRDYRNDPMTRTQLKLIAGMEDPRGIWMLAALKDKNGDSVGKKYLLGESWSGSIDLTDKDNYGVVRAYVGLPKRLHASAEPRYIVDGKVTDTPFHTVMLSSEAGNKAADMLAYKTAIKFGWKPDYAAKAFLGSDVAAAKEWTELQEGLPVDRKPVANGRIEKQGTLFCVKNDKGENFGCYPSMQEATARLSSIQVHARGIQHFGITKADKDILSKFDDAPKHGGKLSKRAVLLSKAGYLKRDGFHFAITPKGRAALLGTEVECGSGHGHKMTSPSLLKKHVGPGLRKPNQSFKLPGVIKPPKPHVKLYNKGKSIKADYMGEPMAGNMAYSHIDPAVWFHPPSEKNPKRVPGDDPREDDDKYLDVTKRNSKDTQLFRMKLLKRQQTPGGMEQVPARTTLINPHTAVYMPSMFDAAADKKIKQRPAKPAGGKRTHVSYSRRGCI